MEDTPFMSEQEQLAEIEKLSYAKSLGHDISAQEKERRRVFGRQFAEENAFRAEKNSQDEKYTKAIKDLESGKLSPGLAIELEDEIMPDPADVANMSGEQHRLMDERIGLKNKLQQTRIRMEKEANATIAAKEIISERSSELQKMLSEMSQEEREKWFRKMQG